MKQWRFFGFIPPMLVAGLLLVLVFGAIGVLAAVPAAPQAPDSPDAATIVDDFQSGVPAGWFTYADWVGGASIGVSGYVTSTLLQPGAVENTVLKVTYTIAGWGAGGGRDLAPDDWSGYDGLSFWFYGQNAGTNYRLILSDNKSTTVPGDTAERFATVFVDDFTGWKQLTFPWEVFYRDAYQPGGGNTPNDGLTLTEMWAYAISPVSGSGVFYLDQVKTFDYGAQQPLTVAFEQSIYSVTEGDTASITVTLSMPSTDPVTVTYATSNGTASSSDYTSAGGQLVFAPGVISASFLVTTTEDTQVENSETINLALSNPLNAQLGAKDTATLSIVDNDQANVCSLHTKSVDDFESGLPTGLDGDGLGIGFITWGDTWNGTTVEISDTLVVAGSPLELPGQSGATHVLKVDVNAIGWGGVTHAFENETIDTWVSQDWSSYEGVSFWIYGHNSGISLMFEVQDNRNPGSTTADAEIWSYAFTDNFTGWKYFSLPWSAFTRKEIGNGAPNDGFGRTEVHAWAFGTLATGGAATYYVEDVSLIVRTASIDDFEGGLPTGLDGDGLGIGFITWGDTWNGTTVEISDTLVAEGAPLSLPCQSGATHVLKVDVNAIGWGGVTHAFENETIDTWVSQDWSTYEGISFWIYGHNSGISLMFEVQDNRNPGSTTADAEIWSYAFTDNFTGWKYFEVPFSAFTRKEIGNGAPNDGFGRTEVHAWAFGTLATGGAATYYVENVDIYGNTSSSQTLQARFLAVDYHVTEGAQATVLVQLNMEPAEAVSVTYTTEPAYSGNRALADRDYTPISGVLNFAAGETEKSFQVSTLQDGKHEGAELLRLRLADPHNVALGMPYRARLNIDDDDPLVPTLLDDFEKFPYLHTPSAGVILDTLEIASGNSMALPGQGAFEHVLVVSTAELLEILNVSLSSGITYAQARDWSGYDALSFWYYGANSGQTITVEMQENRAADPGPSGWGLVWSDEFEGAAGTTPNAANWTHEIGDGFDQANIGWGNGEFEYYTNSTDNSALDGAGNLVITAREVDTTTTQLECWYGLCEYTSARLISSQKFEAAYGRIEARLKVPYGQGMWPAFWMLGNDIGDVGWPDSGEIDIMENIGKEPDMVHGTLHGPGYSGGAGIGGSYTLSSGNFSDDFHVFAIEWEPGVIRWYVDGNLYLTKTSADIPGGTTWVFDHPFFLIMNVAVGGTWPGSPDDTTVFPQTMQVDYVRVYQAADTAERFDASFVDNFSGWGKVSVPFAFFARSATQPVGAPNDGLTLEEVWGYRFVLPSGGIFYFDQISLIDLFKQYFPMSFKQ